MRLQMYNIRFLTKAIFVKVSKYVTTEHHICRGVMHYKVNILHTGTKSEKIIFVNTLLIIF